MANEMTAVQYSFSGGELDVGLRNRLDWQKRESGAEEIHNGIVLPTGGVIKRAGFRFVNEALHHDKPVTLVEFEFSADQVYMLEFGENVMRFYWDGGIILNPDGTEYRIATPYTAAQAQKFRYAQDRDILYFAHIDAAPQADPLGPHRLALGRGVRRRQPDCLRDRPGVFRRRLERP